MTLLRANELVYIKSGSRGTLFQSSFSRREFNFPYDEFAMSNEKMHNSNQDSFGLYLSEYRLGLILYNLIDALINGSNALCMDTHLSWHHRLTRLLL